jgi:hypothetical protein
MAATATKRVSCASSSGYVPTACRPPMARYSAATAPPPAASRPGPSPPIHVLIMTAATSNGRYGNLSTVRWRGRLAVTATTVTAAATKYPRGRIMTALSDASESAFIQRLTWDPGWLCPPAPLPPYHVVSANHDAVPFSDTALRCAIFCCRWFQSTWPGQALRRARTSGRLCPRRPKRLS